MANWTRQSILTPEHIINVVSSGTKVYYAGRATSITGRPLINYEPDIYEYDLATGTETKIMDSGTINIESIAVFNNVLYFIGVTVDSVTHFPDEEVWVRVYRWNGSLNNVSLVHTVFNAIGGSELNAPNVARLYANSDYLVALAINDVAFYDPIQLVHYTSGVGWGSGSLPFSARDVTPGRYTYCADFEPGIYEILYDYDASLWKAVRFSGSGFSLHQGTLPSESSAMYYTDPTGTLHWTNYADVNYYLNPSMSTATGASPSDVFAQLQIQMPYSVGMKDPGTGGMDLYTTTNGTWTLLENVQQFPFGPSLSAGSTWVVRANNGEVFIFGRNATTSNSEVWIRDETIPLASVGSAALLYWGANALQFNKELQI